MCTWGECHLVLKEEIVLRYDSLQTYHLCVWRRWYTTNVLLPNYCTTTLLNAFLQLLLCATNVLMGPLCSLLAFGFRSCLLSYWITSLYQSLLLSHKISMLLEYLLLLHFHLSLLILIKVETLKNSYILCQSCSTHQFLTGFKFTFGQFSWIKIEFQLVWFERRWYLLIQYCYKICASEPGMC